MSEEPYRLLQAVFEAGGSAHWSELMGALRVDSRMLRQNARILISAGLIEAVGPSGDHLQLRLTQKGADELGRGVTSQPARTLTLRIDTIEKSGLEMVRTSLRANSTQVAEGIVRQSSHRLAAIRYLLVLAPGSVSADVALNASLEIGNALLPACRLCKRSDDLASLPKATCGNCVRGVVRREIGLLPGNKWVRLNLVVAPPWTYVPWELAATRTTSYVALDSKISIVRGLADEGVTARNSFMPSCASTVIAIPTPNSDAETTQFLREADDISDVIKGTSANVTTRIIEFASGSVLRQAVTDARASAVHLIGHGAPGGLRTSLGRLMSSEIVEALSGTGVGLAVLGSCFGATDFGTNEYGASLAAQLAASGIRAVVAFEGQVEAQHGHQFALKMYDEIMQNRSIDAAVRSGRKELVAAGAPFYQWGQISLFVAGDYR